MFRGVLVAAAAVFASAPATAATYYFSDQPAVCCASYNAYSKFVPSGLTLDPGDVIDLTLNFKNGKHINLPGTNYLGITTLVRGGDNQSTYATSFTTELLGLSQTFPFESAGSVTSHFGLYAYANGGYERVGHPSVTFTGVHQTLTFDSGPSFVVSTIDIDVGAGAPEPATWTMMLIGFGAIGGSSRRARGCSGRSPVIVVR
jgi:hypothetical protein